MRRVDPVLLLGALAVLVAIASLEGFRLVEAPFDYVLWSDRDLYRASRLLQDWPTTGAELSFVEDARVPGGFLQVLWAIPLALSSAPEAVFRWGVVLDVVGLVVLATAVGRRAGAWAGVVAAALAVSAPASTETMLRLWNPGFVPAFCAAQVATTLAIASGAGPLAWAVLGLVTSLGAQLHLGLLLFGAGLALGLQAEPIRRRLAGAGAALTGLLLGYAPHLVDEALHGWPNTRALLGSRSTDVVPQRDALQVALGFAHQLSIGTTPSSPGAAWANLLHLGALAALVGALVRWRPSTRGPWTGVLAVAIGALAIPAFHLQEAKVHLGAGWDGRYMLPAATAVAALAGLGWGRLHAVAAARSRVGAALLAAVVSAAAVAGPRTAREALPHPGVEGWAFQAEAIEAVRAKTGWSLREVAGRTSIWKSQRPNPWYYRAEQGIAYLQALEGSTFPGSLAPPCAAVLHFGAVELPDGATVADLEATLAQDLGGIRLIEQSVVGDHRLVLYDVGGGHCPTTLSDRYVALPEEDVIHGVWRELASGAVVEVDGVDGGRRFVGRYVPSTGGLGLAVAVDLLASPGRVDVRLHGNQLRGQGYNPGLLSVAMIGHARLVLEGDGGTVQIPLAVDLVGHRGVLTPLSAAGTVPAGTWRASLAAEWVPVAGDAWPLRDAKREPFVLPLADALVVP